jgi:hypothetical protein
VIVRATTSALLTQVGPIVTPAAANERVIDEFEASVVALAVIVVDRQTPSENTLNP